MLNDFVEASLSIININQIVYKNLHERLVINQALGARHCIES